MVENVLTNWLPDKLLSVFFLTNVNFLIPLLILILFLLIISFINTTKVLLKLLYFFLICLTLFSGLLVVSVESFGFIFLTTEIVLLFFFLIVYTQISTKVVQKKLLNTKHFSIIGLAIFLGGVYLTPSTLNFEYYANYYASIDLISTADFFFIYYFLVCCWDVVLLITLILGMFSFYFIILFYNLRQINNTTLKNKKSIYFLRKQSLIHQSVYNAYLRWFQ